LVWSDISVCPNIIKPHFSLKNQGGVEKTPYVLLYIKRIILTSLKLGEVAVCLSASVGLLGWYGWLACATNGNRSKPFIVGRPTAHASHPYQPRRPTEAGRQVVLVL